MDEGAELIEAGTSDLDRIPPKDTCITSIDKAALGYIVNHHRFWYRAHDAVERMEDALDFPLLPLLLAHITNRKHNVAVTSNRLQRR